MLGKQAFLIGAGEGKARCETPRPLFVRIASGVRVANALRANPLCRVLIPRPTTHKKTDLKGRLFIGAGEGIRTLDINLGKVALYP